MVSCNYCSSFFQSFFVSISHSFPMRFFFTPGKTENCKVFLCFQGVEKGYIGNKWVSSNVCMSLKSTFYQWDILFCFRFLVLWFYCLQDQFHCLRSMKCSYHLMILLYSKISVKSVYYRIFFEAIFSRKEAIV